MDLVARPVSDSIICTSASPATADTMSRTTETVLVVEDSRPEQMRMIALLEGFGYNVLTAGNGRQALEIMRRSDVQLVVSDWRMPEMTGIELCRKLRSDTTFDQPYVILVTGYNSTNDLVAGMDGGADDFIAKPFSSEELRVRLQAGSRVLRLRNEAEQRNQQLTEALSREEEANKLIGRDLAIAARMQREFLPVPHSPFPQLGIGTLFRAAAMVAGDGYDFFRLDKDHLGFYQIDVAGHGVAAAMMSFAVSRLLSPELCRKALGDQMADDFATTECDLPEHIVAPARVVQWMNRHILEHDDVQHYLTMVYGVLNVHTGAGVLCQAGHPHPLIVSRDGRVTRVGNGGFAVGMLEDASYEQLDFRLEQGERLFLYSDGISDSTGRDGIRFGTLRLSRLLENTSEHSLSDGVVMIDAALQAWLGKAPDDDISLLAIERRMSGEQS
jgi:sigma-B regulation protein RsbU (phosphoserine phosphatase)